MGNTLKAILVICLFIGQAHATTIAAKLVHEGATSVVTMHFTDQNGAAATPSQVYYWVDDVVTDTRLYGPVTCCTAGSSGWCTAVNCAATISSAVITVTLPTEANKIITDSEAFEKHAVTAIFRYGGSACDTAEADCKRGVDDLMYEVENAHVVVGGTTPAPSPQPTPTP